MLTEAAAYAALSTVFAERGIRVQPNVRIVNDGIEIALDGFDEGSRVGFELVTDEHHDRARFTDVVIAAIARWNESGRRFVFLVDERDIEEEAELVDAARRFLDEVAKRRAGGRDA
jgi:hypothetical protein